ncbi:alpha/beta hydrolase [Croceibacterium aestuarii]|uniref:alpha/beta hydrolase n=1 Tax=Croceibacterium aestuarii TaxID=3064139 RepID=UPI00272E20D4|nr:alpha/beta fold hydrolase [Croceibacterium sp. D39]
MKFLLTALAAGLALAAAPAAAQDMARLSWQTMHSKAMEGNLEGNSADRTVLVVTPPGYDEHPNKRYPVVYFLHGYWATPQMYEDMAKFEEAVQGAAADGSEVILVMPDGYSKLKGGFYSNSPTVGNYQDFVGKDLVAWVDKTYRTIPTRAGRGLSGHSMGGYGTLRLGMTYPETFDSLFVMSACCLAPMTVTPEALQKAAAMTDEDAAKADFGGLAGVSTLAAWAPDPHNPPLYIDTSMTDDGKVDPLVNAELTANAMLAWVPSHIPALKSFDAIALDIGTKDFLLAQNQQLHDQLTHFGVEHSWTNYDGDHGNRIAARIRSELLPFFAKHLEKAH